MTDKPRILFVDDEQRVLNAMRGLFRRDFELFLTTKGAEAVRLVGEHAIDVLVADQRMPGMTGVEVLERVKTLSPVTVRILLTGYADLDAIEASINCGEVFRFLSKPCPPDELRATLLQAVETARATAATTVQVATPAAEPPDHTATIVPFPSAEEEDTQINEVILAGDEVTHRTSSGSSSSDNSGIGVVVYTIDPMFAETAVRALQSQREASIATNLVGVTRILEENRAGVLLTDFTDDVALLRSMINTLKRFLPELVTIVASENRDASEMIALINYGQVFRYISKSLDPESLLTDVNAAVVKHQQLVQQPALLQRHAVLNDADTSQPKLTRFVDSLSKISRPWRHSNG